MLSIERCTQILNNGKSKYSEEEILELRHLFTLIANIAIETFYDDNEQQSQTRSSDEPGKHG